MKRLLIIGASGFLGRHLIEYLGRASDYQVHGTYHTHLPQDAGCHWYRADVVNQGQMDGLLERVRPDVVVHLAAISGVEEAEQWPHRATAVNVGGTEAIARLCAQYDARLIFLSTDYVFSGDQGPYREDEAPSPVVHYGKTKWEAEQAIGRQLCRWSILRTSLLYGWPHPEGHGNLATGIIRRLESGQPFYGYTDMYRSPTYVADVIQAILRLVQEGEGDQGTYHLAGGDWVNMYDFARVVAEVFQLDTHLLVPASAPSQESKGFRPKLLGLECRWSAQSLGLSPASLVSGLAQMYQERSLV